MVEQLDLFADPERQARWARALARGGDFDIAKFFPGAVEVRKISADERVSLDMRLEGRRHPAPLPRAVANRELVQTLGDWLAPHFGGGECMNFTGTYSDRYGQSHGCMYARNVIRDFRAFLGQQRRSGERWCIGVEKHPTGRDVLHLHALVGGVWSEEDMRSAQRLWTTYRGWAKAKRVLREVGCVEYAAKHLLKQGAEDHFEFHLAHQVYPSRYARRAARRAGLA